MVAKTPSQRQADMKARRKAAGLLKSTVWAHPDDVPSIREHAAKLARRRERETFRALEMKIMKRDYPAMFAGPVDE